MSKLGVTPRSSMGMPTTVMKSVPSPGSPSHTPSGCALVLVSSWLSFFFFCIASLRASMFSGATSSPFMSAASGTAGSSWLSACMKGGMALALSCTLFSATGASGSATAAFLVRLVARGFFSSTAAVAAAALACISAMAASSAFDLRPRCLGKEASSSSMDCCEAFCGAFSLSFLSATGWSLKS